MSVARRRIEPVDRPAHRWVFVSSAAVSDTALLLLWLRQVVDPADTVVLRRRPATVEETRRDTVPDEPYPGVERAAHRIVAQSLRATVEFTDDIVAALDGADGYAAGVRDLDPVPVAVLRAAEEAGLPGVCKVQGAYPYRTDDGSRASQRRAELLQRARDQRSAEDTRDRALQARQDARRAAQPRTRSTNPVLGRRGSQRTVGAAG